MEQYKKETEGGSPMNELRLKELADKIRAIMVAKQRLSIAQAYLELSAEEKKGIGNDEMAKIMSLVNEKRLKEIAKKIRETMAIEQGSGAWQAFKKIPEEELRGIRKNEIDKMVNAIKAEEKKKKEKEIFSPEWTKKAVNYTLGIKRGDPDD